MGPVCVMMSDILIGKDGEKIIIDKIRECFNISRYFSLIILNDNDTPNSELNESDTGKWRSINRPIKNWRFPWLKN